MKTVFARISQSEGKPRAKRLGTQMGSRIGRERKSGEPADFPGETASRAGVAATGKTDSEAMFDLSPKIYYAKQTQVGWCCIGGLPWSEKPRCAAIKTRSSGVLSGPHPPLFA